jgi:hypothetical protein
MAGQKDAQGLPIGDPLGLEKAEQQLADLHPPKRSRRKATDAGEGAAA